MRLTVSKVVAHDVQGPFQFAEGFAKAKLHSLGYNRWDTKVKVSRRTYASAGWRGYDGRARRTSKVRGLGRVFIFLADNLPPHEHVYPRFKDMPIFTLWNKTESLIYIAAHEFGHIVGWPGGKDGEIACCKFGYAAVQAWRDRQYEHPACLI